MSFYVSTATFFLLHCDEWDRIVALQRHKFVTGATLLQLEIHVWDGHKHVVGLNQSKGFQSSPLTIWFPLTDIVIVIVILVKICLDILLELWNMFNCISDTKSVDFKRIATKIFIWYSTFLSFRFVNLFLFVIIWNY